VSPPQTFRSPTALVIWVVWLLFAVGNWIDLAVQGRDHASAIAAAVLLLATGVAYVTAQRPRLLAGDAAVTIRNPLRDYRIGWAAVARVDLADLLRVHCEWTAPDGRPRRKVISAWAVHYSRRRQLAAEVRARRAARPRRSSLVLPSGGRGLSGGHGLSGGRGAPYGAPVQAPDPPSAEAEAEKIARLLTARAEAARAEAARAEAADAPAGAAQAAPTDTPAGAARNAAAPDAAARPEPLTSTWSPRAIAALVIPALIVLLVWLL